MGGTSRIKMALLVAGLAACSGNPSAGPSGTGWEGSDINEAQRRSTSTYVGVLRSGPSCLEVAPNDQPPWPSRHFNVYELRLPEHYSMELNPAAIIGPDGNRIAAEGDRIEVKGTIPDTATSTCVPPVIEATAIVVVQSQN